MTQLFMGNALWHLIMQSDWVCKITMLILLGMSIVCWTIFFYKLLILRNQKKQIDKAVTELKHTRTMDELVNISMKSAGTTPGYFLSHELIHAKGIVERSREFGKKSMAQEEIALIENSCYKRIDDFIAHDESYLLFLSGSAAVSPLLGLFGTVWGLVHAFVRISEKQSADIATVAPGIAEALITTLAGLIVAIPALVMFVYLSGKIKKLEQAYIYMADAYSAVVQRNI